MLKIFLLILALSFSFSAHAREIYHISGVGVFVEAENSNDARKIALDNGEKKAFDELMKRFLDYGYMDEAKILSDKQIDSIISSMKVKEEKITDKTYSAKLDFWFNPIKTARTFKIKHDEGNPTRSRFLVLPMIVEAGNISIWEEKWLESWANYRQKNLLVPIGDLEDIQLLNLEEIKHGDYKSVDSIARRYKAPVIIIAKAEYVSLENSMKIKLEKLEGKDTKLYELSYPGEIGIGAYELYDIAANDVLYKLQNNQLVAEEEATEETEEKPDYYRQYDSDRAHKFKELKATIPANDLAEWSRIRRKILKSKYIEELKVESFNAGEVAVNIKYNGSLSQLITAMNLYGMNLKSDDTKSWKLEESKEAIIDVDTMSEEDISKQREAEKMQKLREHRYIEDE